MLTEWMRTPPVQVKGGQTSVSLACCKHLRLHAYYNTVEAAFLSVKPHQEGASQICTLLSAPAEAIIFPLGDQLTLSTEPLCLL